MVVNLYVANGYSRKSLGLMVQLRGTRHGLWPKDIPKRRVEISLTPMKGPNMARGGVNSLFKTSTNSLEQEVSK